MADLNLQLVTEAIAQSRFAGKLQHFATIDSTNIRAVAVAADNAPDGTVFIADEQTAGRGRGGHSWHSTAGDGLYVSAIVRPKMALAEALWLSLATGLAAQRAIFETTKLRADIRWPNDLLIGSKKCGGILVETATFPGTPAQLRYAVIGMGINTNHERFPSELSELATSLRIESGTIASREVLLAHLLLALDSEITALDGELNGTRNGPQNGPGLLERFTAASSWVRGKRVRVDEEGGYTGTTAGLNREGFLQVASDGGAMRTVLSGGVRPE
jgi:BirA family biotin operon repressor/biotin-[acetyl-CoA-carboxylase] ligase